MTETNNSSDEPNLSAIAASACSTASRSMIGRMRCFRGPTRLRASATKLRGTAELDERLRGAAPQARPGADEIERRARRAREVTRRRAELSGLDPLDPGRELRLEHGDLVALERRRHDRVGALEEVVHDLDALGTGAEARKRVHEPLQPVVVVDDLSRRRVAEQIRLVVDDERNLAVDVHRVHEAVQQDAVVLEREVTLLLDTGERRH